MKEVICAAVDCKYNDENNQCLAENVILNEHYLHTKHEGLKHCWTCLQYKQSDRAKELEEKFADLLYKVNHGHI